MSRAAANLELRSEVVSSSVDPDALGPSLEAVAILRCAIAGCRGLQASQSLAEPIQHIIDFVSRACAMGLPVVTANSWAAWRLLDESITCGLELVGIINPEEAASSAFWSVPLSIMASTLLTLKAQL